MCTFSTAGLCHEAVLQSNVHSLVDNFLGINSLPSRKMALGHTKSNQGQKWQMVLEFCIAVNYHKDQCPGFCEKQKKAQIIVIEKYDQNCCSMHVPIRQTSFISNLVLY